MQRYTYKVELTPEEDGYTVTCHDLPGAVTFGRDIPEALAMAADCLATYLGFLASEGRNIPAPTDYPSNARVTWVSFETEASYIMGPCVSAAEAARMLGVSRSRVSQMVAAGQLRSNRKGGHLYIEEQSVRHRMEERPSSGRPRKVAAVL